MLMVQEGQYQNYPVVSILIAAYNAGQWLAATLDSVLAQTYPRCEVIVVNDGSTDETADILQSYQDRHGIRFFNQTNKGPSAANNLGFSNSTGDYIKFLDSDDLLSPEAVAVQVAALKDCPVRLAYGIWGRFYSHPDETVFTPHPGWHDSDSPIDWIVETWEDTEPMYQCGQFLIPRELLDRVGCWDERLKLINDFEFFTRIVLASSGIVFTPEARLYYRSGLPGSVSVQKSRLALNSARVSNLLAIDQLLTAEDSHRTRRVSADILQNFLQSFYPAHPDLVSEMQQEIARLGGSSLLPGGGRVFRSICHLSGWRTALYVRYLISKLKGMVKD